MPCRDRNRPVPRDGGLPRIGPPCRRRAARARLPARHGQPRSLAASNGLMLTGGGDVDPVAVRRGAARDVSAVGGRARCIRDWPRQGRDRRRAADLRHLPRHAGAERRARRHAGPGHPVDGERRRASLGAGAALRTSRTKCGSRRARGSPRSWPTSSKARPARSTAATIRRSRPSRRAGTCRAPRPTA